MHSAKRLTGLAALIIPLLLVGCSGPYSTLDPAGSAARDAAWLWWAMAIYAMGVTVVVVGLWLYAMYRKPQAQSEAQQRVVGRRWIIGGGLILPLFSITLLLIFGIPAGHRMLALPPDEGEPVRVEVTGHQWWWEVHYPDSGIRLENELHIPAGVPVDVHLRSDDVIHSFWVPRLGGKMDMVPGWNNVLRLEADEPGTYHGLCAEFCGRGHAHMKFTVEAHEPEDFEAWKQEALAND